MYILRFEKVSFEEWEKEVNKTGLLRESAFHHAVNRYIIEKGLFKNGKADLHAVWESIRLPERATKYSAGYDFFTPIKISLDRGSMITIPTGIKWNPGKDKMNTYLSIYPRSSLGRDYSLREPNIVSIIDADYYGNESNEGHIFVNLKNEGDSDRMCVIEAGKAYAQGIIQTYYLVDDDTATGVRSGGFGSTNV